MTKEQFRQMTDKKLVFLDGATGSNLQKEGMPSGVCPELWITEHPEILKKLQREYADAGANIVYAPTFSANRIKLKEFGLEERVGELNRRLVELSKEAVGDRALVAGDLTMTGEQLFPIGRLDFEELVDIYKEQIGYLAEAGADLLVIETMMSLQETRAALIAAKETAPKLPVMATMTFEDGGRSLFGTDAVTAAVVLSSLGADAVGANCSTGPDRMAEVIRQMAEVTDVPIIAKPNAGLPQLDENGQTVYGLDAEGFGREMEALWEAGAAVLGGCCGSTPAHIRAMTERLSAKKPLSHGNTGRSYLASERSCLGFGLSDPFLIVGERINPTGKKKLQAELLEGCFETVTRFAQEQEERGASVLDVNMGMSGIDEKAAMLQALEEIAGVTKLPLSIDSSHVEVQEAALRRYPGRALINSISLEKEKLEKLLPLAKKYGAMFVLLPLSDKGLPESLEEKISIIDTIVERALELGMKKQDIVVDGLVTTVGANPKAALETLETIRYCRQKGLATTCGLSNISFGLPERSCVNTAFLTMAIQAGLTMAIANPSQDLLVGAAFASDLLLNREGSDLRYIGFAQEYDERQKKRQAAPVRQAAAGERTDCQPMPEKGAQPEKQEKTAQPEHQEKAAQPGEGSPADAVFEAVLKGKRKNAEPLTRQALEAGYGAPELLNGYLLPAINQVGELFDKGRYFLPQLIASAEAMKRAIGVLEPLLLKESEGADKPVAVVATVHGDIHDIGKNLVALMLKNYGFEVVDLGKDVPKEVIVETALEKGAQLIGLSALMTTTMQEMRNVIAYAKEKGVTAKIMIGGAVITQEYADEIGADGYSRDAAEAVRLAKRLLQIQEKESLEEKKA